MENEAPNAGFLLLSPVLQSNAPTTSIRDMAARAKNQSGDAAITEEALRMLAGDSQSFSREYTRYPQRLHDQQARKSQLQALETKQRQLQEISDYIGKLPERKTRQQRAWLEQQQAELQREIEDSKARTNKLARSWTLRSEHLPQDDTVFDKNPVDETAQMEYNREEPDYDQFEEVLGELLTIDPEEFYQLQQNDPAGWEKLKNQYRILDGYKVDAGSLTKTEIATLDRVVFTEKRAKFTKGYRKGGNIAGAFLDGDSSKMYFAHSSISDPQKAENYVGSSDFVLMSDNLQFDYIPVTKKNGEIRNDTWRDTEAKLFEYFAVLYEKAPFKSITMLSERGMCDSCKYVMRQFQEQYPNVTINVVSNIMVEGNVWGWRKLWNTILGRI